MLLSLLIQAIACSKINGMETGVGSGRDLRLETQETVVITIPLPFKYKRIPSNIMTTNEVYVTTTIDGGDIKDYLINHTNGKVQIIHINTCQVFAQKTREQSIIMVNGKKVIFQHKYIDAADFVPAIFDAEIINNVSINRYYYSSWTKWYAISEICYDSTLEIEMPKFDKITSEMTVPEMIPTHTNLDKYFKRFTELLIEMQSKQDKLVSVTIIKDQSSKINALPDLKSLQQNEVIIINGSHNYDIDLKNDQIFIAKPISFNFICTNQLAQNINSYKHDILQAYYPINIEKNCVFESSIITLEITGEVKTRIQEPINVGSSCIFKGLTNLKHFTQNVKTGDNIIFNDCFIGPGTIIGNNCSLNNVIIHANSKIGNNVSISNRVLVGQNVTIGDNVVIKDYVIIEDNVEIGNNVVIRNNVYIYKNATIKTGVNLDRGIIVGRNATIEKGSKLDGCCSVGNSASVGESCTIFNNAKICDKTIVKNGCKLANNILVKGQCGTKTELRNNVFINQGSVGDNCILIDSITFNADSSCGNSTHLWNGVTLNISSVGNECYITNGVTLNGGSRCGNNNQLWDCVTLNCSKIGNNCKLRGVVTLNSVQSCGDYNEFWQNVTVNSGKFGNNNKLTNMVIFTGSCGSNCSFSNGYMHYGRSSDNTHKSG